MKIRVAVLFGGESVEHEVSIISASQAMNALNPEKYEVVPVYISKDRDFYSGPELRNVQTFTDMNTLKKNVPLVHLVKKDGKVFVNTSGSPAMAKGGSGDVLCGVIAGLIGLGMEECEAASMGVYVHGLAGECAAKNFGVHSVLASELADCLGEVMNEAI